MINLLISVIFLTTVAWLIEARMKMNTPHFIDDDFRFKEEGAAKDEEQEV